MNMCKSQILLVKHLSFIPVNLKLIIQKQKYFRYSKINTND